MTGSRPTHPPGHPISRIKSAPTEPLTGYRRSMGLGLGALLGFAYGLVSQMINRLALPGVPLFQPPLGPAGNTVLCAVVGAGLGFLSALPASAALGIALSSAAATLVIMSNTLLRLAGELNAGTQVVFGVLLSVPLSWFAVPVIALLRWAVDRQVEQHARGEPPLTRARIPLALVLVMVFVAAFELMDGSAQDQVRHMQRTVEAALVGDAANLPEPLRGPLVHDFPTGRDQRYTLEWTRQELERFIELRPGSNYDQHAAVIARFEDGYRLVCLYPTAHSSPTCGTY